MASAPCRSAVEERLERIERLGLRLVARAGRRLDLGEFLARLDPFPAALPTLVRRRSIATVQRLT
jgi:hypothetical protein